MKKCSGLKHLTCGSPQLTNESAPAIAEVLRVLHKVSAIGLHSRIDDGGFVEIKATLCDIANRLTRLNLYWTRVSPALLSKTLSSLANLMGFTLVGNPIGDDGFHQVASSLRQLRSLERLHLCDIGVTWRCLAELEKVLLSCSKVRNGCLFAEKRSFLPAGEDTAKVSSLTTLRLTGEREWIESYYGYHLTYRMMLRNEQLQAVALYFYG